jgi:hypothetical protein
MALPLPSLLCISIAAETVMWSSESAFLTELQAFEHRDHIILIYNLGQSRALGLKHSTHSIVEVRNNNFKTLITAED